MLILINQKFDVPAESIIDKRDFLISGTEVPDHFLGEAKVALFDPTGVEFKRTVFKFKNFNYFYRIVKPKQYYRKDP